MTYARGSFGSCGPRSRPVHYGTDLMPLSGRVAAQNTTSGDSPAPGGRVRAPCRGEGRGIESRRPLHRHAGQPRQTPGLTAFRAGLLPMTAHGVAHELGDHRSHDRITSPTRHRVASAYAPIGAQLHGATARRSVQVICAHVLARSAYSQGARDRQIWARASITPAARGRPGPGPARTGSHPHQLRAGRTFTGWMRLGRVRLRGYAPADVRRSAVMRAHVDGRSTNPWLRRRSGERSCGRKRDIPRSARVPRSTGAAHLA
jgi:hypothetical protein